jgi:hypothetical protein
VRKQKDYIAVKMGEHGKELTIADKQTIMNLIKNNKSTTKLRNKNETKYNETKNEVGRHIIDHLQEELYLCKLFSHRGL